MKTRFAEAATILALVSCNAPEPEGNVTAEEIADRLSQMKIRPGRWEARNEIVSISAPGLPREALDKMAGRKTSVSNCITPEQAARPNANFLAAQKDSNCTYQDWWMEGGRMKGMMTCQGGETPGKVVMKMDGRYGEESYQLNMTMETTQLPGGLAMQVTARTAGRRTGECS